MCIFYPCTKILRTQKFAKQALFTTAKEIIHDINSPLIRYHTDIEFITTFLRHTCVSSSDRHDIFNFSYDPHENVAVNNPFSSKNNTFRTHSATGQTTLCTKNAS